MRVSRGPRIDRLPPHLLTAVAPSLPLFSCKAYWDAWHWGLVGAEAGEELGFWASCTWSKARGGEDLQSWGWEVEDPGGK